MASLTSSRSIGTELHPTNSSASSDFRFRFRPFIWWRYPYTRFLFLFLIPISLSDPFSLGYLHLHRYLDLNLYLYLYLSIPAYRPSSPSYCYLTFPLSTPLSSVIGDRYNPDCSYVEKKLFFISSHFRPPRFCSFSSHHIMLWFNSKAIASVSLARPTPTTLPSTSCSIASLTMIVFAFRRFSTRYPIPRTNSPSLCQNHCPIP